MFKKVIILIFVLSLTSLTGCETVNRGAEKVGETTGKAMRVPISASEGAAKGIAGEEKSNPYKR